MGACLCDVVDVEARIDLKDSEVRVVKLIAGGVVRGEWVRQDWEWSRRWWKCQVFVQILRVVAEQIPRLEGFNETVVQVEHVLPVSKVWSDDNLLLHGAVANDWIVD